VIYADRGLPKLKVFESKKGDKGNWIPGKRPLK
jgi:hypothetical protein